MEKNKMIEDIQKIQAGDIHQIMDAVMARYRELYPDWEIYCFSMERCGEKERRQKLGEIMEFAYRHGV